MIICLTGTQGQGKTYLLNQLKEKGHNVRFNTTAREVLAEHHITLEEVYTNPNLSINFQDEILNRQIAYDAKLCEAAEIYVSERSYIDIFVYALMAVGRLNKYESWLQDYYDKCLDAQSKCGGIIYIYGRKFTPKNDGVRSTSKLFADSVDVVMDHHLKQLPKETQKVLRVDDNNRLYQTEKALSYFEHTASEERKTLQLRRN